MGLFSKLKALKGEADAVRAASGSLGSVSVPGEGRLRLPAGRVRITYEQRPPTFAVTGSDKRLGTQPKIEVTVEGLDVQPVSAHSGFGDADLQRASLATVEVPDAGTYTVATRPLRDFYSREGLEPRVLLDPISSG